MIISRCSQRSSCFDRPVLSKVEGGERLWIILNWKPYKEASHVYYPSP